MQVADTHILTHTVPFNMIWIYTSKGPVLAIVPKVSLTSYMQVPQTGTDGGGMEWRGEGGYVLCCNYGKMCSSLIFFLSLRWSCCCFEIVTLFIQIILHVLFRLVQARAAGIQFLFGMQMYTNLSVKVLLPYFMFIILWWYCSNEKKWSVFGKHSVWALCGLRSNKLIAQCHTHKKKNK